MKTVRSIIFYSFCRKILFPQLSDVGSVFQITEITDQRISYYWILWTKHRNDSTIVLFILIFLSNNFQLGKVNQDG